MIQDQRNKTITQNKIVNLYNLLMYEDWSYLHETYDNIRVEIMVVYSLFIQLKLGLLEIEYESKCLWQVPSKSDERSEIKTHFANKKPSTDDNIWYDMIWSIVIRWIPSIGERWKCMKIRKSDYVILLICNNEK